MKNAIPHPFPYKMSTHTQSTEYREYTAKAIATTADTVNVAEAARTICVCVHREKTKRYAKNKRSNVIVDKMFATWLQLGFILGFALFFTFLAIHNHCCCFAFSIHLYHPPENLRELLKYFQSIVQSQVIKDQSKSHFPVFVVILMLYMPIDRPLIIIPRWSVLWLMPLVDLIIYPFRCLLCIFVRTIDGSLKHIYTHTHTQPHGNTRPSYNVTIFAFTTTQRKLSQAQIYYMYCKIKTKENRILIYCILYIVYMGQLQILQNSVLHRTYIIINK